MAPSRDKLIWISTRVPYPPVTGHFLRSYNVLKGLAAQYDVFFFGFFDRGTSDGAAEQARSALASFCVEVHAEHVRSERSLAWFAIDFARSVLAWKPFVAVKYFSPRMDAAIHNVLSRHAVSLIHADSLPSGEYARRRACAKLLTNHNVEFKRLRSHADLHPSVFMRSFLRWQAYLLLGYELQLIREIGCCVVVSETDRTTLATLVPDADYFVVNNGADASSPPLCARVGGEPTVLSVGGMGDAYNRDAALYFYDEILPRVHREIPRLRWRVVGANPPPLLVDAARRAGSHIDLAGFVDDVRREYEHADIVVVPLRAGGGTKLKVLEAMAAGRAVVTTPVGAEGILARDGIELEIATSADEFTARVVALMRDPERRFRLAAAGRALIERAYDWRIVDAQMQRAVSASIAAAVSPVAANGVGH